MKVSLVYPSTRKVSLPPPSLALFSRLLQDQGHEVDLFDTSYYDIPLGQIDGFSQVDATVVKQQRLQVASSEPIEHEGKGDVLDGLYGAISSFGPDLIAVTTTESTFPLAEFLLKDLRERERIPTVVGGVYATFAPEQVLKHDVFDYCAVGEGEHSLLELVSRMSQGLSTRSIQGIWAKDDGTVFKTGQGELADVNEIPTNLDYGMFDSRRHIRPMSGLGGTHNYKMLPIGTHWGCPFKCTFCNSPAQNVKFGAEFFRKRKPERILEELAHCRDSYGMEYVFFWADTFLAWSDDEFRAFCEMYEDIRLPFWMQTRLETVKEWKIKRLLEVGLDKMSFGVEHGNPRFRREVIDRYPTNEEMLRAVQILEELGVPYTANNIIGYPYETEELLLDTIEFNRKMHANERSCSILMPYAGTRMREMAVSEGWLSPDIICPSNNDAPVMNMPPPYLQRDQISFYSNTFELFSKFGKDEWSRIYKAKDSPELLQKLREEYAERFPREESIG